MNGTFATKESVPHQRAARQVSAPTRQPQTSPACSYYRCLKGETPRPCTSVAFETAQKIVFTITVGAGAPNTYSFTNLASAEEFFDDDAFSLGNLPREDDLSIDFDLKLTSMGGGDMLDTETIFGSAVPEPSTWALLATSGALLIWRSRRAKSRLRARIPSRKEERCFKPTSN